MAAKVFIDGEAGTTGLQISTRLEGRSDVELLRLADDERKDPYRRRHMLNAADLVILCLPDDAAREAVGLIENNVTKVIDASTAHRTADGWVYGMPEYARDQNDLIAAATRVTNPGCYANASIAILHPLVEQGIVPADWPITINAVSGYSGGGKGLINAFEDEASADFTTEAFRVYGLGLDHKHIPEIQRWSGLSHRPLFVPSVGRFRQGMIVQIPLQLNAIPGNPSSASVSDALSSHYAGRRFVSVSVLHDIFQMDPELLNGTNELRLHVFSNDEHGQVVVMGVLDNLGKGASGQAVQNMNLMLGLPEETGLVQAA
jgi:N-acetyl-gamma-glutamyl-phosphate reductase